MNPLIAAARNDARELRLMIRRCRLIAVSCVVVALLSGAGALIVNSFGDAKPTDAAVALAIDALLCLGGAFLGTSYVFHFRSILKEIERAIDQLAGSNGSAVVEETPVTRADTQSAGATREQRTMSIDVEPRRPWNEVLRGAAATTAGAALWIWIVVMIPVAVDGPWSLSTIGRMTLVALEALPLVFVVAVAIQRLPRGWYRQR